MKLVKKIVEKVIRLNMGMLFSETDFTISSDENTGIYTITLCESLSTVMLEIQEEKSIRAMNLLTYEISSYEDEEIDLLRCVQAIIRQLRRIAKIDCIYDGDEFVIISFSEIGVDKNDGSRDLIISRYNGGYSLVKFNSDNSTITIEIPTISDLRATIQHYLDIGYKLDFHRARIMNYIDSSLYEDDDEDF